MNIFGNDSTNQFDQELNTDDAVIFASVSVAAAPTTGDQLANKAYVDGGGSGGPYLQLTGGTMSGTLNAPAFAVIGGNSAEFLKADGTTDANTYLTIADAGTTYLPLGGGTLTGELNASAGVNASVVLTSDVHPVGYNDMNVGLTNVDILRLGGNGVFIKNGNMAGVQTLTANTFVKTGGVDTQYLMADGSTLTRSANSGNSNFYLYNSKDGAGGPPISAGDIEYNNAVQGAATTIWISHLTRDLVDIEVFFPQINSITQVYLQDQENSTNFIRYGVTGVPSIVAGNYVAVPVAVVESGGTGATSFGSNHNILMVVFTDGAEVDARLTTLEDKTQNQVAIAGTTTFTGTGGVVAKTFVKVGGTAAQFLKADGTIDSNTYLTTSAATFLPLSGGLMTGAINSLGVLQLGNASTTALTLGRALIPTTINGGEITVDGGGSVKINSGLTGSNALLIGHTTTGAIQLGSITSLETKVVGSTVGVDGATVSIGTGTSNGTTVGRAGVATSIRGTVNISQVYTLPITAPAVGQVITCDAVGSSSWITPSAAILPSNVVTFTVSGTYTPTVGTKRVEVYVLGGGGGGGGCVASQNNSCGSGGGSGALAIGIFIITTGTASVVVGAGGAGAGGAAGLAGAASSFTYGVSTLTATGGAGGLTQNSGTAGSDRYISTANQTAASATIPANSAVFVGGYARSGTIGLYGVMLDPDYGTGGNGGASEYGVGGAGSTATGGNNIGTGGAGTIGSGGGGAIQTVGTAAASRAGGAGGIGIVRIIEYF